MQTKQPSIHALALVVALACPAPAQEPPTQFASPWNPYLPYDQSWTRTAVTGDLDGDGDLDLLLGNSRDGNCAYPLDSTLNRVFLNDGKGRFAALPDSHSPPVLTDTFVVVVADFDGDRDLDYVSCDFATVRLWLNDGTGKFVDSTAGRLSIPQTVYQMVAGDVDHNGGLDLLFFGRSRIELQLNDGKGRFSPSLFTFPIVASVADLELVDVDNDRHLDALIHRIPLELWLGDGKGAFTDASATHLPQPPAADLARLSVHDFDADGDPDILATGVPPSYAWQLLLGDPSGKFRKASAIGLPTARTTEQPSLVDFDGDGDMDVVTLLFSNTRPELAAFANDGRASFSAVAGALPLPRSPAWASPVFGDFDRDGDADAIVPSLLQEEYYLNDGKGRFRDALRLRVPQLRGRNTGITVGDIDGDSDPDLIATGEYGPLPVPSVLAYVNDSFASFDPDPARMPTLDRTLTRPRLSDLDRDGDLDLLVTSSSGLSLLANDGKGRFVDESSGRLPVHSDGISFDIADLDGDGDSDLFTSAPGQNRIYINDGKGVFVDETSRRLPSLPTTCWDIDAADLDGDGDVDVLATQTSSVLLYLNSGTGTFVEASSSRLPALTTLVVRATITDVDADGDRDVVVAGNQAMPELLWINDGKGKFADETSTRLPPNSHTTQDIAAADLDEDGDVDLVLANGNCSFPQTLLLNDGKGMFADASQERGLAGNQTAHAVAAADLDDDGDVDLVFANSGSQGLPVEILVNRHRHLENPTVTRLGATFDLRFRTEPGYARSDRFVVPLFGASPARIPAAPFGVLRLEPSTIVPSAMLRTTPPAGTVDLLCPVPAVSGLIGASVFAQAFVLPDPRNSKDTGRLTAVVYDVITVH